MTRQRLPAVLWPPMVGNVVIGTGVMMVQGTLMLCIQVTLLYAAGQFVLFSYFAPPTSSTGWASRRLS